LQANIALAANSDTALLAARGFSGVTLIPPENEAERLGGLPLEVLFRDASESEALLETFHRWGVRNLRALVALPEVALSERLGQEGLRLQRLARGAAARTLVPVDPPLVFEEEIELEHPLVLLEPLAFALNKMLEQICGRLASHALTAQELRLELELKPNPEQAFPDHGEPGVAAAPLRAGPARPSRAEARQFTRTLRLPVPLLDARIFLKLLQLDLKAHPPGAPIVKIHLTAQPARPRAAQGGLFLPPTPEPEKLELTLARIAGIVGKNRVGSLEILDTHRPEGFRMQHFTPGEPQGLQCVCEDSNLKAVGKPNSLFSAAKRRKNEAHGASRGSNGEMSQPRRGERQSVLHQEPFAAWLKPCPDTNQQESGVGHSAVTALRIFRPALRAAVTLRDGQPAHIACQKRKEVQGDVIWLAGPWRSSGDWWEQEGWRRDEWDIAVESASGIALYRLVRDLLRGVWLVEGTYD
jgi:nucleotidyltransferase/DNA polymerase involved in DNA repair